MLTDKLKMGLMGVANIEFISQVTKQNTGSSYDIVIASPPDVLAGDLLIAFLQSDNSSAAFYTETGWTEVCDTNGVCIKWKVATDSNGGATFDTSTPSLLNGSIVVFRNAAFHVVGSLTTSASSPISSGSTDVSVSDCVLLAYVSKYATSRTITSTTMTSISSNADATPPSWAVFMEQLSSAGYGLSRDFNVGAGTSSGSAIAMVIKPN